MFGSSSARSQSDLVEERVEHKPDTFTEELNPSSGVFPGLISLHEMRDMEMVEFFTNVLRSRPRLYGFEVSLGPKYQCTEKLVTNVARVNVVHTMSKEDQATLITNVLQSRQGGNVIGCRIETVFDTGTDNMSTKVYAKILDKSIIPPVLNENNEVVEAGDSEFFPTIKLTFRP